MQNTWVSRIMIVTLLGGLCLVGYGLAQAAKPIQTRFVVLSKDPAWVLDRTTGLQWQKATTTDYMAWSTASTLCADLGDGSRIPEVKELIGLLDYSQVSDQGPALPVGHPFQVYIGVGRYWTATNDIVLPGNTDVFYVEITRGFVGSDQKTKVYSVWCVR